MRNRRNAHPQNNAQQNGQQQQKRSHGIFGLINGLGKALTKHSGPNPNAVVPHSGGMTNSDLDAVYGKQSDMSTYTPQTQARLRGALDAEIAALTPKPATEPFEPLHTPATLDGMASKAASDLGTSVDAFAPPPPPVYGQDDSPSLLNRNLHSSSDETKTEIVPLWEPPGKQLHMSDSGRAFYVDAPELSSAFQATLDGGSMSKSEEGSSSRKVKEAAPKKAKAREMTPEEMMRMAKALEASMSAEHEQRMAQGAAIQTSSEEEKTNKTSLGFDGSGNTNANSEARQNYARQNLNVQDAGPRTFGEQKRTAPVNMDPVPQKAPPKTAGLGDGTVDPFALAKLTAVNNPAFVQMGPPKPQINTLQLGNPPSFNVPPIPKYAITSDERKKTKTQKPSNELTEFLDALKAYSYDYKEPEAPGQSPGRKVGVMAQDLEKSEIGKQAVLETPHGKMVDFGKLAPVTLAAVVTERKANQDQDARIEDLERLLKKLT